MFGCTPPPSPQTDTPKHPTHIIVDQIVPNRDVYFNDSKYILNVWIYALEFPRYWRYKVWSGPRALAHNYQ